MQLCLPLHETTASNAPDQTRRFLQIQSTRSGVLGFLAGSKALVYL